MSLVKQVLIFAWIVKMSRHAMTICSCLAIFSMCAAAAVAVDIPYVDHAIRAGNEAGQMSVSAVWALVACVSFSCAVLLGWVFITMGSKLQITLATLVTKVDNLATMKTTCPNSEHVHMLVQAARDEIERTGRLARGQE